MAQPPTKTFRQSPCSGANQSSSAFLVATLYVLHNTFVLETIYGDSLGHDSIFLSILQMKLAMIEKALPDRHSAEVELVREVT